MLGREALIAQLAAYKRIKAHRITVVFDGTSAPHGTPNEDRPRGIRVRFSRSGETADTVIERMVRRERERALVVSSDRRLAAAAEACGAATVDAKEFEHRMMLALYAQGDPSPADPDGGWTPTTKKKGPARRPPRRARSNRSRIDKL
jgi:predicted RNA-binding protein with PIN domain